MIYQDRTMVIPNNEEFSVPQLKDLLQQLEHVLGRRLSLQEWQAL
jgi:hypothetical protein